MARAGEAKRPSWEQRLIHREMVNPSAIGGKLIASAFGREVETLKRMVGEISRGRTTDDEIELCVMSIMAQCHFFAHSRRHEVGGLPWPNLPSKTTDEVVALIIMFSLAGIEAATRSR